MQNKRTGNRNKMLKAQGMPETLLYGVGAQIQENRYSAFWIELSWIIPYQRDAVPEMNWKTRLDERRKAIAIAAACIN